MTAAKLKLRRAQQISLVDVGGVTEWISSVPLNAPPGQLALLDNEPEGKATRMKDHSVDEPQQTARPQFIEWAANRRD